MNKHPVITRRINEISGANPRSYPINSMINNTIQTTVNITKIAPIMK